MAVQDLAKGGELILGVDVEGCHAQMESMYLKEQYTGRRDTRVEGKDSKDRSGYEIQVARLANCAQCTQPLNFSRVSRISLGEWYHADRPSTDR